MSKIDAMRAMREAKYAARQAQAGPAGATTSRRLMAPPAEASPAVATSAEAPPAEAPPGEAAAAAEAEADAAEALCGHRSMNGRTCTREQGHAAKSHRYG